MKSISYRPIGVIHTPFQDPKAMPIQPAGAKGVKGTIDLDPEFKTGLKDITGFSHLILIYHFHLSEGYKLKVTPFLDTLSHGVFSTRAPRRPNPIGLSVVTLKAVEETTLYIEDVDMLDGTPLLDLKPYVPRFDARDNTRIGWLEKNIEEVKEKKSDSRFVEE